MKIKRNQDLTQFNNYRIKSTCKRAFFPESEEDFVLLYKQYSDTNKIILGGGNNIILSKQKYTEDFLIIGDTFSKVKLLENNIIEAEAGLGMKQLSELALANNLTGLEIFYDIPSSVGGAVVMNAGASGIEIKDIFLKARYLDLNDFIIKEIDQSETLFEYRNSFFQRHTDKIVLRVWFQLQNGDHGKIRDKMDEVKSSRWAKQPKDFPNAGSVFKRPNGFYVGTMIEELGLKGFSVGGAKVSEKHAGFIVNYNNATGRDVLDLIDIIKEKVFNKYHVSLEVEQRII